jgi:hypothetical protein
MTVLALNTRALVAVLGPACPQLGVSGSDSTVVIVVVIRVRDKRLVVSS